MRTPGPGAIRAPILLLLLATLPAASPRTEASQPESLLDESYRSLVDPETRVYPHAKICEDLATLCRRFPERARLERVGESVWGREILALVLGQRGATPARKILVMGNMHAREIHSAPLIVRQIELYLHNWDRSFQGAPIRQLLTENAIYFVPTTNPDGNEIVHDGIRCMERDTDLWDGACIPPRVPDRDAAMERIRTWIAASAIQLKQQYGRVISPYRFSGKDLVIFKANANGVDLHYNFYEPDVNAGYFLAQRARRGCVYARPGPATEGFVGERGIDQPETIAVRDFIERHDLREYSLTYHGRFPKLFYDYTLGWGTDVPRARREFLRRVALEQVALSGSPLAESASGPVGFCGWFQQKYRGLSFNIETGYAEFRGRRAYCPLPVEQMPAIWAAQRLVPLQFLVSIGRG